VRILKKKKAGSGNEAVQARLHGVPGTWCVVSVEEGGGRDEAGALILNQYGVPGAWSQPEEGDEAGALILNQYVPGACSEAGALILNQYGVPGACYRGPGRRNMGFQARGLSPKKAEAGTRPELGPERLSSTNVESQVRDLGPKKVKVGCLKPEEGELQEEATTGSKDLLSEYVLGAWSQTEEDGGGDKAGVPILKQYGVPGARSQLEEDGGGNQDGGEERPEYLCKDKAGRAHPQPTRGSEVRKFKLKKTQAWKLKLKKGKDKAWKLKLKETEARTRQGQGREDVSSTNMGFRGVEAQAEEGQEQGVEAQAEEDRGKDKAWKLKLKKGKNKAWTLKRKKTEARRRPGVDAQAEEDGGKEQAWKLKRKKTEVWKLKPKKTVWKLKLNKTEECKEYARYLGIDPGYEGEETHNAMLCPSLGAWSQPEKNTEAGIRCDVSQPEETGGGDEAGTTGSQSGEGEGGEEVRGLNLKKAEGTRPEGLSSTNMGSQPEEGEGGDEAGVKSHPGEGGGGDEAKALILNQYGVLGAWSDSPKKAEAGGVVSQPEEGGGGDEARTRPESLSSTNMGFQGKRGVEAQDEEDRGKDEVWKHKLKKTEVWKHKLKKTEARRDLGSVQQDPAMLSEQSSGRYIVSDDVELPEDRVQYSDVNLLRQALLDAREFLRSGYTEIHFRVWGRDEPMKLLCARSAKQHEGTMELYLTYEDGGEEEGLLHPAGTGCTGPLFAFASRRQDGIPAPRRRLGRAHTIVFFKNDLVEWTAARGEAKRCKEGLVHHMRPRSSIMSQSGIQVLSLSGNNVGEGRDEAGALILNQDGVSGAWSEAEKTAEAGGDEAGALIINQDEVSGAWSQAEEGEGGDEAGALILNQDGVSGAWSEAEKTAEAGGDEAGALIINQDEVSGAWSQAEDGGGGDEAGALIINQDGVSGAWSQAEEGEGGDEAGALILNQDGVSGAWSEAEKTAEVGTRPERLSSTKMGCQVLGGDEAGALILNQYGVSGAWPEAEKTAEAGTRPEGGGGDEAGALILNQDGVSGAWPEAEKTAEAGTRPEGGGGDEAGALILNQDGVSGAWSQAEDGGGGDEAGGDEAGALVLNQDGVSGAWSQAEDGGGRDEAGGDEAGALILNQDGVSGAWSEAEKTAEAGTRPERLSSTNMVSQVHAPKHAEEDGGEDKAWDLKQNTAEARTRCVVSSREDGGGWDEAGGDEAGALILNQDGVSGVKSHPGEGGGGDEAKAIILNKSGVRGVKSHPGEGGGGDEAKALILNQYGVLGACSDSPKKAEAGCVVSQPEEGGGGDEAGADEAGELVLNQYGVSGKAEDKAGRAYPQSVWDSEAWELSLKKAGGLILNQDGISGAWSEAEKTAEAGTKPVCDVSQPEETGGEDEAGALTLNQYGVPGVTSHSPKKLEVRGLNLKNPEKAEVRGLNLKKAEGTRSEGLSSTNMGSQPEEGEGGDEAGGETAALVLNQHGVPGVKSHPGEGGGVEAQAEEDGGKDEVWKLKQKKTEARTRPGVEAQAEEDVDKDEVWKLKPKKTEARARCGSSPKKSQARTRSSIMSQSGIQVLSLSGNNVGGGDTDESRRLACREIRLSSTNTASQVLREQGQSAMGLGVRGPSPKKAAGTRLERLSSTTVGFEISSPEAEEGEGGDEAGALILNQDGVSGAWSEAEKTAEAGGDEAGALILNQDGVSGIGWSQAEDGGGGDEAGALIINQDGVSGAWSQAEEGEGGDEAGALILNQDGVSGAWSEAEKTAEVRGLNPKETRAWLCKELCVSTREAVAQENLPKSDKARRDLRSVQQDPAMLSEQSLGRYIVSDDVELPEDRVQYSDVNLLRQALLDAREFLRSGYTEIHFRVWRRDEPMKLLCARSAKQHEGTMELYLTYEDGGEEEGLLHPAGTGCTGPLFAFASRRQDGIPAPRRRLGRAHTIFFFKNDLVEWTAKRCKEGLVRHMRPRSSIMSQSGIQVLSLSGNNVGGGDTDESRRLACREIRLSSTNTASQVLREQGQSAMGLGVRGPSPKKAAGTRLERLSSTTVGFEISSPEAEEGEGGDEAGALILNQDGVSGAWSEAEKTAEAGALIINQVGVSGAWFEAEKTAEAGTRPERLSSTKMVSQVRGLKPKTAEAGTRPERLSSTKMGSQVRGLKPKKAKAGTRPERLSSTKMVSQVRGLKPKTAEAGTRPERLSSTKMGSQVRGLKPKKAKAGTRPERLSSTKMGCQVRGLKLRRRRR
ncbi:unnamed protein product, partial [Symbiodinium sp. CCMP2592]